MFPVRQLPSQPDQVHHGLEGDGAEDPVGRGTGVNAITFRFTAILIVISTDFLYILARTYNDRFPFYENMALGPYSQTKLSKLN